MVVAKDKRNALRQCFGALHVVDVEIEILSELVPKSWEEFVLARLTN